MLLFVSNYRTENERKKLNKENLQIKESFEILFQNIKTKYIFLNLNEKDLQTKKGILKARKLLINYLDNTTENITTLLLGASTKRIFGRNGKELKERYPNILFTIGDNGTALLLKKDVISMIKRKKITKQDNILILGASGILGSEILNLLTKEKYENIYIKTNLENKSIEIAKNKKNIISVRNLEELKNISLVVACTHFENSKLTKNIIKKIKRRNKKLFIVDVAEPDNVEPKIREDLKEDILWVKGGNGYSKKIKYNQNKEMNIMDNTTFGCFSEAIALEYNQKGKTKDWFEVNEENQKLIDKIFAKSEITNINN